MVVFDDRQVYSKQALFSKAFGVMFSPYKRQSSMLRR